MEDKRENAKVCRTLQDRYAVILHAHDFLTSPQRGEGDVSIEDRRNKAWAALGGVRQQLLAVCGFPLFLSLLMVL